MLRTRSLVAVGGRLFPLTADPLRRFGPSGGAARAVAPALASAAAAPRVGAAPGRARFSGAAAAAAAAAAASTAPAPALLAASPAEPLSRDDVRALDVRGVVALVESFGVDAEDAETLAKEKITGMDLPELTVRELLSCGMRVGPAHTVVRATAALVARAASAARPAARPAERSVDEIRALDVRGVVALVELIGVDADDAKILEARETDGEKLLSMTYNDLDSYGVSGASSYRIVRAIRAAAAGESAAPADPSAVLLTVWSSVHSTKACTSWVVELTPELYRLAYGFARPLKLATKDRVVVREIHTLEEAVEQLRLNPTFRLHTNVWNERPIEEVRCLRSS